MNADIDWENVAEEIETLGRSDRFAVESHLETVIEHLLKLTLSPAVYPRHGWRVSVVKARAELARRLSGTLRNHLLESLPDRFDQGRHQAVVGMQPDAIAPSGLPPTCPWTLDQLLDRDFWPPNRHGLD